MYKHKRNEGNKNKMITNKIAGKFGQIEHWSGRFFVGFATYFYITTHNQKIFLLMTLGWTYLIAHTLEKMFYGRNGPRG